MKILIIGCNGQVGQSLVDVCQNQHIEFKAISRNELDVSKEVELKAFFEKYHDFDFVINAAAYTQVDQAENEKDIANSVNKLAVEYIAQNCAHYDIPLIHISTDYIFDGKKTTMYCEKDLPNPLNTYGSSKLAGEEVLQKYWHKHIILRVSWVFSEYRSNFIKTMVRLSSEKEILNIIADQHGAPTSARSIARVILHICKQKVEDFSVDQWGIYHYTDFPTTTWHQLASYCIEKIKQKDMNRVKTKNIYPIISDQYPTVATRPKNSSLDVNKIKTDFNINQASWLDEVDRVVSIVMKEKNLCII